MSLFTELRDVRKLLKEFPEKFDALVKPVRDELLEMHDDIVSVQSDLRAVLEMKPAINKLIELLEKATEEDAITGIGIELDKPEQH